MDISQLDELILRCNLEPLTETAIASFLTEMSREEFCDYFSRHVAHEYAADRMSFDTADTAMNSLWIFAYLVEDSFMPPYSMDVFLAFDDGEYHHDDDTEETDRELKYTRPQILEIVARGQRA